MMQNLFEGLNVGQRQAVETLDGPVLLIAGPGSGKTLTLVRRTLNLILNGHAAPEEIVLCTFTEKSALQLRDRVRKVAADINYTGDLTGLKVGTIHGIANDYIERNRHHTSLGANYEILDDLTQYLFLYENFKEIVPDPDEGQFFGAWSTKWSTINEVLPYFDKITEELIDPELLISDSNPFISALGIGYQNYEAALKNKNKIDFAHLQRAFVDLLRNPEVGPKIISSIKYVMVDEFQDTNYIQELIADTLSQATGNLCVVGDEDQSLYRFRGATVRNILEFKHRHPNCTSIPLEVNYRSHEGIVAKYNAFMDAHDWSNPTGPNFRFNKTIKASESYSHPNYPSVVRINELSPVKTASELADLVEFLKDQGTIEDYSQVAILLYSVKYKHSQPYIDALKAKGIRSFCPRARAYFNNEEVRTVVAALSIVLDYFGVNRGNGSGGALDKMTAYVDECVAELCNEYPLGDPLDTTLKTFAKEVAALSGDATLDKRLLDYIFLLLGTPPFTAWAKEENRARNLATFSQLLDIFHRYYGYPIVSAKNLQNLRFSFFNSFLRFLLDGGINEYEDKDQPFPKDHVQILTIHQSKGLEFPVVAVGSLGDNISVRKKVDETLAPFYTKQPFEPSSRITDFDRLRLHYVAFSRAEKLLILMHGDAKDPKKHFMPIWKSLPTWPAVRPNLEIEHTWAHKPHLPAERAYSFTRDLKVYETCARQYQYFREYEFSPARTVMVFFGLVVHQTIEDIHRHQLEGRGTEIGERFIEDRFTQNYNHLATRERRQMAPAQKAAALQQIKTYWRENQDLIARVVETEIDVTLQKDGYILEGAIDLVASDSNTLDILDFKAQQRPATSTPMVDSYYKQLCIYAHILEQRHGRKPDRLIIYWTAEPTRDAAMMIFEYNETDVAAAAAHFESVVRAIEAQEFDVVRVPEEKVCNECDLRPLCYADGVLATPNQRSARKSKG